MKTKAQDPAALTELLSWKEIGPDGNGRCWGRVEGMTHICGGALDSKGVCAVCAGWMAARNQPPGYDLAVERIATALERIATALERPRVPAWKAFLTEKPIPKPKARKVKG